MVSHLNLLQLLSMDDWIVFGAILLLTLASIFYGHRLKKTTSTSRAETVELLLMGRSLTLPLFVATLVATWYGGILGVTAQTFEKGIYNFLTQGLLWYFSYLIFAFFLIKKIRSKNVLTLPEMAGRMFGPKAEKISAILNFFNLLPIAYTISLGLFLKTIFGGDLFTNTLIGVGIVTLWSLLGGFRAVVFTDVVQFVFMILGVLLVVIFAWFKMGSPFEVFLELPPTHLSLTGGQSLSLIVVWGFIALSTLVDPNFYQRVLAAKDEKVAKRGIIISTFIWFVFDVCTTLGALYARVAIPQADPQEAYLQFSLQLVPNGVRGLIISGVLATILSSLDAYLFNAATCVSYDLFKNKNSFRPLHHHLALILVAILSIMLGTHFEGNIVEVWKTLGSFSAACLLFPLLIGHFYPQRISDSAFCWGVSLGCISIVTWRIVAPESLTNLVDPFYVGLLFTSIPILPSVFKKRI